MVPSPPRRSWRIAGLLAGGLLLAVGAQVPLANPAHATSGVPNPNADTKVSTVVNADGTVTATLSGTWTRRQSCKIDFSTAWAVDWWGVSDSPLPTNNVTLSNATAVPGPGATTRASVMSVGAQRIHDWNHWGNWLNWLDWKNWLGLKNWNGHDDAYFHVARYFAGESVHSAPGGCSDRGLSYSTGPWSAAATYPSVSAVPAQICTILYDTHGFLGHPSSLSSSYDPVRNWDNSIASHAFDPRSGNGFCVNTDVTTPPPPPPPPANSGYVEVCVNGTDGLTGTVAFAFAGTTQAIPVGSCGPATRVPVGFLPINEVSDTAALTAATTIPVDRLAEAALSYNYVVVRIVEGGVDAQTLVQLTASPVSGTVKLCQVAGAGVAVGTEFAYTTPVGPVSVPAGPAPGGYCKVLGTGSGQVTIVQQDTATAVTGLSVNPASRYVSSGGAARQVTIQVGTGVTEITVTNSNAP